MGESPGTRRVLLGATPASARHRNISHAYAHGQKVALPCVGRLGKWINNRGHSAAGRTARPAMQERFPRACCSADSLLVAAIAIDHRGKWNQYVALRLVNRLCAPRSEERRVGK